MKRAMQLSQNSQHITLTHDQIFHAVEFHFSTGIFSVEHGIAGFQYHFFVFGSVAGSQNFTLKRFFLSGVRNDDATSCFSSAGAGLMSTRSANGLIFIACTFIFCCFIINVFKTEQPYHSCPYVHRTQGFIFRVALYYAKSVPKFHSRCI